MNQQRTNPVHEPRAAPVAEIEGGTGLSALRYR